MLRTFCWCLAFFLYWAIVVHFLRTASPVFIDGGGPMPSFEWGRMPQPNLGEYTRRLNHYNLIYSLPYYFAGLVLTLVGCGVTPAIVGRFRAWSSHAFRSAIATTLALAILLVIASDVGTLYGVWSGPLFLLHRYHDFSSVWALCQALLPAPILSGVIAVAKRWLATGQRHISG